MAGNLLLVAIPFCNVALEGECSHFDFLKLEDKFWIVKQTHCFSEAGGLSSVKALFLIKFCCEEKSD